MWRAEVRQANPNHVRVGYRVKRRHLIFGVGARWSSADVLQYCPRTRVLLDSVDLLDSSGGGNLVPPDLEKAR